jgi:hypothetical protein
MRGSPILRYRERRRRSTPADFGRWGIPDNSAEHNGERKHSGTHENPAAMDRPVIVHTGRDDFAMNGGRESIGAC